MPWFSNAVRSGREGRISTDRAENVLDRQSVVSAVAAGTAAQVAGLIWIFQWAHALVAYGTTSVNMKRLWLGLTWIDSAKFLALSFVLLVPAVLFLSGRFRTRTRAFRVIRLILILTLVVAAIGTLLEFGLYGWGSYVPPRSPLANIGGVAQAMSSLVLAFLFGAFALAAARRGGFPGLLAPVLASGALATVFPGGPNFFFGITLPPLPGLAWVIFGGWLLTQHRDPQDTRVG